ncbi:hypothetical protein HDU93_006886, partial [Gonapodya sp. JEL0774]
WLPTDVAVDKDGHATINSYINNLDRYRYPRVYGAVRAVFEGMLPMFERAVDALETKPPRLIDASLDSSDFMDSRDEWRPKRWLEIKFGSVEAAPPKLVEDSYWDWPEDMLAEYQEYWDEHDDDDERPLSYPLLPDPNTVDFSYLDLKNTVNLKGRTLQVIFKLATIILTPEKPKYAGGNWHLEGMENEAIAAT